jgi:putative transposase
MARQKRTDVGGYVYHILNRANAKAVIFENERDYCVFENILEEAKEKFEMRILAYCLMPNHWHLVLFPENDGDLARFMGWVSNTHAQRWHAIKDTVGQGHLYQGRYKSFLCQEDAHFLALVRYVERNAKKANLVSKAQQWKWSSVWRRESGTIQQKKLLAPWPVSEPRDYIDSLNEPQSEAEEGAFENAEKRGSPYGSLSWTTTVIEEFDLESTVKPRGRPKKGG